MTKNGIKLKLKDLTVMFVDDEEFVVETMQEILPMLFKNSYFANNGLDGISQAKKNKIDILITDLSMPKMNGIDMIKKIKEFSSDTKIICVSGHNESEFVQKAQELKSLFIIKPISSSELFKALEEVL
ncbi:MAG: response regulator [Campylobacterota bacterium]|nr:response regulator [Campylobacterota bacterium]